jgi:hypothetical protein
MWTLPGPARLRVALALGLILLVAAALRLLMIVHAPAFILNRDSGEFFLAGYNLAQGEGFELALKRAPLYGLFLGGIIATLGPDLETITTVQHLLGLLTVLLSYGLGALAFGRPTGLLAALVTAVNGSLLLMEHNVAAEALLAPLLLAGLLLLLGALRSGRLPLFLLAGLALGLGTLVRPVLQATIPLLLAATLLQPRPGRDRLAACGLLGLGLLLSSGPWILRNQVTHGVTSVSGGVGDALFARVTRHDPSFDLPDPDDWPTGAELSPLQRRVFELAETHPFEADLRPILEREFELTPAQGDAALRDAALLIIRRDPSHYLSTTLEMLVDLGQGRQQTADFRWDSRFERRYRETWPAPLRFVLEPAEGWTRADRAIVNATLDLYQDYRLGPLLGLLFVVGALRCLAAGWRAALGLLPLLVVVQLLLYVALNGPLARHRFTLQPLITVVAAGGFSLLIGSGWQLAGRGWRRPGTAPRKPLVRRTPWRCGPDREQAGAPERAP